jgi:myo-inositol 2-dehydrogenase/D-chiro-inositol 1-dehydrogenase|tara:strand:- start:513 stop:1724 length:1212 start_codon:yes stop_codon:yes gene_type:complete
VTKQRLRFFEKSLGQQHITDADKYLYKSPAPTHALAIIGTGTIGQEHMYVATLLGRARVHGIYDSQVQSMDSAEKNFKDYSDQSLIRYADLASACSDPEVDALMICTPNYTHADVLKVAMRSGKPIFLEKPMATTLVDADAIVKANDAYPSFIQIGLQYRYKAQYIEAFHEVQQRTSVGVVKTISMSEYRPPFLDKVGQWNKFNQYSGGTLVEKCCHYFDLINLLADAMPVRVYASGGQAVNFLDFQKDGVPADIDDHAFVIIDYTNGVRANFTLNMFCHDFTEEMVVTGDRGRLVANELFNVHQQQPSKATIVLEKGEWGASKQTDVTYAREIEKSGHHGATYYEHVAFVDQLDGKACESATPVQGLWSMIVASAAQHSIKTQQAVDIRAFMLDNNLADYFD